MQNGIHRLEVFRDGHVPIYLVTHFMYSSFIFSVNKELEFSRWPTNVPAETPFKFAKERVLLNCCLVKTHQRIAAFRQLSSYFQKE